MLYNTLIRRRNSKGRGHQRFEKAFLDGRELSNSEKWGGFPQAKRKPDKEVQLRCAHILFGYTVTNYEAPGISGSEICSLAGNHRELGF